jgi:hypothetical protein
MSTKGPNSFENFFCEPQDYPESGYVFRHNPFNREQAVTYFVDWLMEQWQWLPRENRKYLYNDVRKNIADGFVKWHGYIDDNGDMRNGWVLYHQWLAGEKYFKHVWIVSFEKHFVEHGHHFEPLLSDWGMQHHSSCATCGRLKLAKLQGELEGLRNVVIPSGHFSPIAKELAARKAELEKEISYYDSYK